MNKPPQKPMTNEQLGNMAAKAALAQGMGMKPVKIDPKIVKDAEDMKCMNMIPKINERGVPIEGEFFRCNGEIFVDAYRLKYVSPIMSPIGQQTVGNLMIGKICVACGKVFSPDEWLKERNAKAEGEDKNANTKLSERNKE